MQGYGMDSTDLA